MIKAAGVVIPAHNEQDLLPACLAAVQHAARQARVPVHLVVVADACTDKTADLAFAQGAAVIESGARNVGAARRAGVSQVLRSAHRLDPAEVWVATTDADSLVPRHWLTRQLRYARRGWKGVVGTVTVADWAGHPHQVQRRYAQSYRAWHGHHPHVHGANLGFTADAYLAAGGFRPLPTAEDHALVDDLRAAGVPLLRTAGLPVVTSARRRARAPRGFAWLLGSLAAPDEHGPGPLEERAAGRNRRATPRAGRHGSVLGAAAAPSAGPRRPGHPASRFAEVHQPRACPPATPTAGDKPPLPECPATVRVEPAHRA